MYFVSDLSEQFSDFEGKIFGRVYKTAFWVSRGNILSNIFVKILYLTQPGLANQRRKRKSSYREWVSIRNVYYDGNLNGDVLSFLAGSGLFTFLNKHIIFKYSADSKCFNRVYDGDFECFWVFDMYFSNILTKKNFLCWFWVCSVSLFSVEKIFESKLFSSVIGVLFLFLFLPSFSDFLIAINYMYIH